MMKILDLWVPGQSRPKGSMKHVGGGRMKQSVEGSTQWANIVRRAVVDAKVRGRAGFAERHVPVHVQAIHWVRGDDVVMERAGDVDKLARNVLDALTQVVYADDVQVIRCDAVRLLEDRMGLGLHVAVFALDPADWVQLARGAAGRAAYAYAEMTDPNFRHADGAGLGHDCFAMDCGI